MYIIGHQQLGYDNLNQAALLASPMINIPPISSPMSPISPGSPISSPMFDPKFKKLNKNKYKV